jgi:antitoxin component YwqK of YwqJK toxin-antitoxin module
MKSIFNFLIVLLSLLLLQCNSTKTKREYYSDGAIKLIAEYDKNDQLNGKHIEYFHSGQIKSEGKYSTGKANGIFKW